VEVGAEVLNLLFQNRRDLVVAGHPILLKGA
jgi:hypothetical protein